LGEAFANLTLHLAYVFEENDWNVIRNLASTATLFWDSPSLFSCIKSGFATEESKILNLLSSIVSGLSPNSSLYQVSDAGKAFYNLTLSFKYLNVTYYNITLDKGKTTLARNFFNGMLSQINSSYPFWLKNLPFHVNEHSVRPEFFSLIFEYVLTRHSVFDPNDYQFQDDTEVKFWNFMMLYVS
jgi:hypothetical protein